MATHGDIIDITYSNPTVGSGRFVPVAAQGNTLDVGGIRTSDDANMVGGDGSLILKKNRVRASFEVVVENDMNGSGATEATQLAASSDLTEWTFTLINGTTWRGLGVPVGDIQSDTDAGTFTLKVAAKEFVQI